MRNKLLSMLMITLLLELNITIGVRANEIIETPEDKNKISAEKIYLQEEKLKELEGRIDDLEETTLNLAPLKGGVRSFTSDKIHFGGFVESVLQNDFAKHRFQNNSFFRDANVILLTSAEVTQRLNAFVALYLSVFTEREFKGGPGINPQSELPFDIGSPRILFGEYKFNNFATLRAGKFVTPFGIINQEYFEPLLLQHDKPQALRGFAIFDDTSNGVQLYGTIPIKKHKIGYHAYGATFISDKGDLGGGGRFFWSLPNELLTLGVSNQTGGHDKRNFSAYGADIKFKWKNFTARNEFFYNIFEKEKDQWSFYTQPSLSFFKDKLVLFGQFDYLDDPIGFGRIFDFDYDRNVVTPGIFDLRKKYEYTVGINYLPFPFLRNRLEFTWNNYVGPTASLGGKNRDHFSLQGSATLSF